MQFETLQKEMIAAMKANKRKAKQETILSHSGSSNTAIETA